MPTIDEILNLLYERCKEERQIAIKNVLEKHEGKTFDNLKKVTHIYCHNDVIEKVKEVFGNDVEVVGSAWIEKGMLLFADGSILESVSKITVHSLEINLSL